MASASERICALSSRQRCWLVASEMIVLFLETTLLLQRLFPTSLQLPAHQSILRLHGVIVPSSPVCLVTGTFQLLLPVAMQSLSFLLNIGGRSQMQFQRRRLQYREHLLTHECVKPLAGEVLTRRLAVVDGTAEAPVTEAGARVNVSLWDL